MKGSGSCHRLVQARDAEVGQLARKQPGSEFWKMAWKRWGRPTVQETEMWDWPAWMWAPILHSMLKLPWGYLQSVLISSSVSFSVSSPRTTVSVPSLPFYPNFHKLSPSAWKTRKKQEKVSRRKSLAKPADRKSTARSKHRLASGLCQHLLGGFSWDLGMQILRCRGVGYVAILWLTLLVFLRLQERKFKLRRMRSGRSIMRGGIMEESGLFNRARIMLGSQ